MPKSGTTWAQETIWTLRHNLNFDNPAAKMPLAVRSPVIEYVTHPNTILLFIN